MFLFFAIYLHTLQAVLRPSLFFQLQFAPIKCVRVNLAATKWTQVTVSVLPPPALHSHPRSSRDKTKTGLAVVPNWGTGCYASVVPWKGGSSWKSQVLEVHSTVTAALRVAGICLAHRECQEPFWKFAWCFKIWYQAKSITHFSDNRLNVVPGVITKVITFCGNYAKFILFPLN